MEDDFLNEKLTTEELLKLNNDLLDAQDGLKMKVDGLTAKLNGQEIRIRKLTEQYQKAHYKTEAYKDVLSDVLDMVIPSQEEPINHYDEAIQMRDENLHEV